MLRSQGAPDSGSDSELPMGGRIVPIRGRIQGPLEGIQGPLEGQIAGRFKERVNE